MATSADNIESRGGPILATNRVIAFLSSSDLDRTTRFYHDMLGLKVLEANSMVVVFETGGTQLRVSKVDKPVVAPYTVLGWSVAGIGHRVAALSSKGVRFERFPGLPQNAVGIATFPNGDQVAWFKDPEGHILSLTEFPER